MIGASQIEICNLALGHVAQKAITLITASSPEALACARVWKPALLDTLRSNAWGFAKTIEPLAEVSTYTPLSWEFAYAYPVNCVAVRKVYSDGTVNMTDGEKYDEEHDKTNNVTIIVTDIEDAYIEYTYYITDTTLFDSAFVSALSYRIAAGLAVPLSGDKDLAGDMIQMFNAKISEAQRMSSDESNSQKENQPNRYADSRT